MTTGKSMPALIAHAFYNRETHVHNNLAIHKDVKAIQLQYNHNKSGTGDKEPDGHTQQNEEKHIPTYNHGTRTPDMSLLSYARTEPESLGKLFKFQPDFTYFSSETEPRWLDSLGNPLPKTPVSKSAP